MYKHILVPTDGSPLSAKAVKAAAQLARDMKAKVTALHVIPQYMPPLAVESAVAYPQYSPRDYKASTEKQAQKMLDRVQAAFAEQKVRCETAFVNHDQPWNAIVHAARSKKCDLIVMASHGRRGLAGVLLGSETMKVLTHSKTPVLVCR